MIKKAYDDVDRELCMNAVHLKSVGTVNFDNLVPWHEYELEVVVGSVAE
jgi:hypothetical protein